MDGVTCTSCRVIITSQDEQREHYKSEFHQYNLKRKLVKLDPVSLEIFNTKKAEAEKISSEVHFQCICACCQKQFNTAKAYQKHIEAKRKRESMTESQVVYDPLLACLFCGVSSSNLDNNLKHMMQEHGFFIPDILYVNNVEAMMAYLQKKVREGMICLYCNNKGVNFNSPQAVQQHMRDKQHCFINTEDDEEEFEEFYNWANSDEEGEEEEKEPGNSSAMLLHRNRITAELTSTGELRLENGKILGTKEFARYYKQYYRPRPQYQQQLKAILSEEYKSLAICTSWPQAPKDRVQQAKDTLATDLRQGMKNNHLMKYFRCQNAL